MFRKKKIPVPKETASVDHVTVESSSDKRFKKYQHDAASWDSHRFRRQRAISFMLWFYSCLATMAIFALSLALMYLAPLKTVEPYLIRVDSSTGIAETLSRNDLHNAKWSQSEREAIDRYFLTKYVNAREQYNYALRNQNYLDVSTMSTPAIAEVYQKSANRDNPKSPLNILGRDKVADIKIKSISWPKSDSDEPVAYVRFIRQIKDLSSATPRQFAPEHLLATINYKYINAEITNEARQINPLGFLVTAYQITEEAQVEGGKQ